jgi:hypothetical protein
MGERKVHSWMGAGLLYVYVYNGGAESEKVSF